MEEQNQKIKNQKMVAMAHVKSRLYACNIPLHQNPPRSKKNASFYFVCFCVKLEIQTTQIIKKIRFCRLFISESLRKHQQINVH